MIVDTETGPAGTDVPGETADTDRMVTGQKVAATAGRTIADTVPVGNMSLVKIPTRSNLAERDRMAVATRNPVNADIVPAEMEDMMAGSAGTDVPEETADAGPTETDPKGVANTVPVRIEVTGMTAVTTAGATTITPVRAAGPVTRNPRKDPGSPFPMMSS